MYRFLIDIEAGTPTSFSVPFAGGVISLSKPKQLFVVSPSHIAAPDNKIPFVMPAPISFLIPTFVRDSIATVINF